MDFLRNFKINKESLYRFRFLAGFIVIVALISAWYGSAAAPPKDFPTGSIITVPEGTGLLELSNDLYHEKVIRSPFWFRVAAIALGGERGMRAGGYNLSAPESVFRMAWRIAEGKHGIPTVKITIPEGFTAKKISSLFGLQFLLFSHKQFESLAPEGYMFPDTYFIQTNATATSTIKLLKDNFIRKIFPMMPDVQRSGHSLDDIITMASIIENEANTKEDREIVSGILWKRLRQNVPLQVDATLTYINGKTSAEMTADDLKANSPYNTYKYPGLPPTPISNPGLESIEAALHPEDTPYMYFLTGDDGKMHYARTFDEHKANKAKYLR